MAKITYGDLVTRISDDTGYTEKSVDEILKGYQKTVKEGLKKGDDIVIPNFMSIRAVEKGAKSVYDFKTGKMRTIKPRLGVQITAGKALKESVPTKKKGRPKKK